MSFDLPAARIFMVSVTAAGSANSVELTHLKISSLHRLERLSIVLANSNTAKHFAECPQQKVTRLVADNTKATRTPSQQ